MKNRTMVFLSGMLLALGAGRALAHHSFAAEYDSNKPVTLKGSVTKMEWQNPHARFYVDVADEAGKVTNWELELGSPNGLMRRGWTRNSLKPGHRYRRRIPCQGRQQTGQRPQRDPG